MADIVKNIRLTFRDKAPPVNDLRGEQRAVAIPAKSLSGSFFQQTVTTTVYDFPYKPSVASKLPHYQTEYSH